MGEILDCRKLAEKVKADLKIKIVKYENENGLKPGLAVVTSLSSSGSESYLKNVDKNCRELGVNFFTFNLSIDDKTEDVLKLINDLNLRNDIHGILVQLPLPSGVDEDAVAGAISIDKDIDGFNPVNSGKLFRGEKCFVPCTAKSIISIIEGFGIEVKGKNAAVVGRSNIVGKPAAMKLLEKNATVTLCHSKTRNLSEVLLQSDIVVCATGFPGLVKGNMIKEGAVVIDAGTTVVEGKLKGDSVFDEVIQRASFATPVPGGVGAMTVAMLIENVLEAAEIHVR